jgi:hypothetical protein
LLASLALASAALPVAATPTVASPPTTIFMADHPQHAQVYVENLAITAAPAPDHGILALSIQTNADNSNPVSIALYAISGEELMAGTYIIQRDWPATPNFVRLHVGGNQIGCSRAGATVVIHEIAWTTDTLSKLSLSIVCPIEGTDTAALEVRLNVPDAIPAHATSANGLGWPRVIAGTSGSVRSVTVTSSGSAALVQSAVTLTGTDAADFAITSDTCSGSTLPQGEACAIDVVYTPIDGSTFSRTAWLTIHDNTLNAYRTVKLLGSVRRPTTITLSSVNNPATLPDSPVTIVPTIQPAGATGTVDWYVNGIFQSFTHVGGSLDGAYHPGKLGAYDISATYRGVTEYAPSSSNTVPQIIRSSSSIALVADPSLAGPGLYNVSANVTTYNAQPFGGTLTIYDDTTSRKISEHLLTSSSGDWLGNLSLTGQHVLRATYSGVAPWILASTTSTTVDGPAASAPQPPTQVTAVAGEGSATVSWEEPLATGGSAITGYVATSSPGGGTCASEVRHCTVSGLIAGTPCTFTVRALNLLGTSLPSAASGPVTPLVSGVPTGTISIAAGAAWTRSTNVMLAVPATDAVSGVSQVALSNNGTTWTTRTYAATQSWTLPATNGPRTVYAKWKDAAGNWSAVKSDSIVLDTVAPVLTAPTWRVAAAGTALVGGAMPVRIAWTGTDATSGIARHSLSVQVDGGAWTAISTSLTTPALTRNLAPGHTYRFAVRAIDKAGNTSPWLYGPTFRLTGLQQTAAAVTYGGTWTTSTSTTWWGGTAKSSSAAGATAKVTFTGRQFTWIGLKGANRGKAQIFANGVLLATVDLYSPTQQSQRVIWGGVWSTSATRTITIKVLGTAGRPRVDVDGFFVGN